MGMPLGRIEFVKLLFERGTDPIEPDAEPWAAPKMWLKRWDSMRCCFCCKRMAPDVMLYTN